MADKKVSELNATATVTKDDLLLIVDDPLGTPLSLKIKVGDLLKNYNANVAFTANTVVSRLVVANSSLVITGNNTPANSTITSDQGTIMYDDDYIYVTTRDNTLKRVAISTF